MKILHTSDWHLGHSLYNYDRTEEQMAMLDQMVEIATTQRPDAFIIAGDIYHTAQPPMTSQKMFADTIMKLHKALPQMAIIVTAGNHDSSARHEIFRTPWRALNVHVIGSINNETSSLEKFIIELDNIGFIIAIPYVHERNLPNNFYQTLLDNVEQRNTKKLPVVMTAHTTVRGCNFAGHDINDETSIGGIDYHELSDFGTGFDYLALGHIHHAQFINGSNNHARYSGTPIPISFDENYSHSISLVEINQHGAEPKIENIEIKNPKPLVTLPSQGAAEWAEVKQLFEKFPSDIPAYIRLNVEIEDFVPQNANDEAYTIAESKRCNLCLINPIRQKKSSNKQNFTYTITEFKAEQPIDIARRYISDRGGTFDDDLTTLFNEILSSIDNESSNL